MDTVTLEITGEQALFLKRVLELHHKISNNLKIRDYLPVVRARIENDCVYAASILAQMPEVETTGFFTDLNKPIPVVGFVDEDQRSILTRLAHQECKKLEAAMEAGIPELVPEYPCDAQATYDSWFALQAFIKQVTREQLHQQLAQQDMEEYEMLMRTGGHADDHAEFGHQ